MVRKLSSKWAIDTPILVAASAGQRQQSGGGEGEQGPLHQSSSHVRPDARGVRFVPVLCPVTVTRRRTAQSAQRWNLANPSRTRGFTERSPSFSGHPRQRRGQMVDAAPQRAGDVGIGVDARRRRARRRPGRDSRRRAAPGSGPQIADQVGRADQHAVRVAQAASGTARSSTPEIWTSPVRSGNRSPARPPGDGGRCRAPAGTGRRGRDRRSPPPPRAWSGASRSRSRAARPGRGCRLRPGSGPGRTAPGAARRGAPPVALPAGIVDRHQHQRLGAAAAGIVGERLRLFGPRLGPVVEALQRVDRQDGQAALPGRQPRHRLRPPGRRRSCRRRDRCWISTPRQPRPTARSKNRGTSRAGATMWFSATTTSVSIPSPFDLLTINLASFRSQ